MEKVFDVSVVAIVKDEETYLEEWIAYHVAIGVEHFFIFDNDSTDNTRRLLRKYITLGLVTLIDWPMKPGQIFAYNYAIKIFGHTSKWMALIDIDEFINVVDDVKINKFLEDFADYSQLLVPFLFYGSSGHILRPDGLVTQSYLHAEAETDKVVKCIVQPSRVAYADVHQCFTTDRRTVNENRQIVNEGYRVEAASGKKISINHYYTKSMEEWIIKIRKGQDDEKKKTLELFHAKDFKVPNTSMTRYRDAITGTMARLDAYEASPATFAPLSNLSRLSYARAWFTRAHQAILGYRSALIERKRDEIVNRVDLSRDQAVLNLKPGIDGAEVVAGAATVIEDAFRGFFKEVLYRASAPGPEVRVEIAASDLGRYSLGAVVTSAGGTVLTVVLTGLLPNGNTTEQTRTLRIQPGVSVILASIGEGSHRCTALTIDVKDKQGTSIESFDLRRYF
ncbi:glycosyltransferase family 92 protein [Methylorubrum sp. SB2]|uniref:glycosyltransferase family 92 protein n=1 Tax=Methylorubrum subtropicum TaxID=3138812 RepID=UPI00313DF4D3